jgi:AcrR family transcriptional regulator
MTEPRDRRELIVSTAAEMFARKGIRSTTVREIADVVGVLSGSLYHYFSSKDEIVKEILMGFLDTIRAEYDEVLARGLGAAETLREVVLVSLQVARQQPDATAIYQNELRYLRESPQYSEVQAAAADVQRVWLGVIERGVADGAFRDDIAPRIFHRGLAVGPRSAPRRRVLHRAAGRRHHFYLPRRLLRTPRGNQPPRQAARPVARHDGSSSASLKRSRPAPARIAATVCGSRSGVPSLRGDVGRFVCFEPRKLGTCPGGQAAR